MCVCVHLYRREWLDRIIHQNCVSVHRLGGYILAFIMQKHALKGPVCEIKQPLQDGKHIAEQKNEKKQLVPLCM